MITFFLIGGMKMEEIRFEYDCDVSVPHFHNELEILYVLSGRMGVMLAGATIC